MYYRSLLLGLVLSLSQTISATAENIQISTNNTPLDQAVLNAVGSEAFGSLGYTFELVHLPSERSLRVANDGGVDGEGLRIAGLTEEFPNLIQIDEPIVGISFVAFTKNPNIAIDGFESLNDLRIVFINGWKLFEANTQDVKSVSKVAAPEQMFNMLLADRVDAVLYTLADGLQYLNANEITGVSAVSPSLRDLDLYLYLHNRHAELAEKAREQLVQMKEDGRYDSIISEILPQ